ncbi:lamin tail domain-containing protein [Chloroflexi bacterium TSY]|nr:lamin tail domain-containing protein [Chloroflexi bacterium TSY]
MALLGITTIFMRKNMHNYVPHVQRAHFWRIRRLLSLSLSLFLLSIPLGSFTSHQSIAYGQASDLFFSEYIEGSSNNKAIEIYNGTGTNINLSTYSVEIYNNGASTPNNTEALSGTLIDGDVLVIANSSAAGAILTKADLTSSVTFFNGDDALVLKNNGVVIDMLGVVGTDPGSAWGGGGTTTQDQTIRRLPTICAGDPDGFDNPADISDEWEGFAQDTFDGLGSHTANCNGDPPPPPPDPTTPQILITEIMYNPASAENDWEWVEIYNAGSQTVDLAGYVLDDINSVVVSGSNISAGTIDPGASALLFNIDAITAADFAAAWGAGINLIPVTQWNTLSLNNSGDQVGLWDTVASYTNDNQTHANTIITVNYATSGVWPSADGAGSIYLTDLSLDSSNGNSWALSTVGASTPVFTAYQSNPSGGNSGSDIGSPGMPSAAPTPSLLLTEIVVTPTGGEFVEIYNPNSTAVDLSNVYLTDATFAGGGTFYYNIVTGANAGGGGFADFHARFPDGASIAPDTYQTIALAGSSAFVAEYGIAPTYELFDDGSTNGEQQMRGSPGFYQ